MSGFVKPRPRPPPADATPSPSNHRGPPPTRCGSAAARTGHPPHRPTRFCGSPAGTSWPGCPRGANWAPASMAAISQPPSTAWNTRTPYNPATSPSAARNGCGNPTADATASRPTPACRTAGPANPWTTSSEPPREPPQPGPSAGTSRPLTSSWTSPRRHPSTCSRTTTSSRGGTRNPPTALHLVKHPLSPGNPDRAQVGVANDLERRHLRHNCLRHMGIRRISESSRSRSRPRHTGGVHRSLKRGYVVSAGQRAGGAPGAT
jgi:hypothetical protein